MTTATLDTPTTVFDVKDVEYLRHGDTPLVARVYTPRGEGPFPALVECHGGAWCLSDRLTEHLRHEFMAERGETVATPPAIWFQGQGDLLHDYQDAESDFPGHEPQRFVANYRKAGGEIALEYIAMERHAGHTPDLSQTGNMFERMLDWVKRHVGA